MMVVYDRILWIRKWGSAYPLKSNSNWQINQVTLSDREVGSQSRNMIYKRHMPIVLLVLWLVLDGTLLIISYERPRTRLAK